MPEANDKAVARRGHPATVPPPFYVQHQVCLPPILGNAREHAGKLGLWAWGTVACGDLGPSGRQHVPSGFTEKQSPLPPQLVDGHQM